MGDEFPDSSWPHGLIDQLLLEGQSGDGWHLPAAECPLFKRLQLWPRERLVPFVLGLLVRVLWQLECRGQAAVARLFLLLEVIRSLLSRKLPFEQEQLAALVLLTASPRLAQELGSSVLAQVRWQGAPSEPVRRALKRLKRVGRLCQKIEPLLSREVEVPPTESPLAQRRFKELMAHARRLPDKVSKRWLRKGKVLLEQLGEELVAQELVVWLEKRLPSLNSEHPRLLRGLVVLMGQVKADSVAHLLEEVARFGYTRVQGYGPRAQALAGAAIRSLGELSTPTSLSCLISLGPELRYPSARESLLTALRKAARARGASLHTLLEVETAFWDPKSEMGKRLWRAHARRLERCLRTGREWPAEHWVESYDQSPLLGALGRRLIWRCGAHNFGWDRGCWRNAEGQPYLPDQPVCLWHPADSGGDWEDREQPFPQLARQVYYSCDFESELLLQYKFAALARQRDWHYRLVGRFLGRSQAVLRLGSAKITLEVDRANPRGPFSQEGIALKVRLVGLHSEPSWKELSVRARSETIRDWHLFVKVAGCER